METRDLIPLKAINEATVLQVPNPLSRETALRLVNRGWARWYQVEYTKNNKPKGFVELTGAGRRAIQDL